MSQEQQGEGAGIRIRGYRRVFRIERRLFRFDRWRIPYPHGVPLRGIGYFVAAEFCVLVAARLPGAGLLLGALHPVVAHLGIPLGVAVLLMQVRIDGRPPHRALASLVRFWIGPKCLAGLSPCPGEGIELVPIVDLAIAFDCRESFVVKGCVKGPAKVMFRYPSTCRFSGAPPWIRDGEGRKARARRFHVQRRQDGRPMLQGKVIRVPRHCEVVIE